MITSVTAVHASFRVGQQAYLVGDYARACENFLPLARRGNAAAQYYLGRMHHEGKGLSEDHCRAVEWARKAAEQGNGDAEALLGVIYARGQGVPKDDAEAARWFHKAAHHAMRRDNRRWNVLPAGHRSAKGLRDGLDVVRSGGFANHRARSDV